MLYIILITTIFVSVYSFRHTIRHLAIFNNPRMAFGLLMGLTTFYILAPVWVIVLAQINILLSLIPIIAMLANAYFTKSAVKYYNNHISS